MVSWSSKKVGNIVKVHAGKRVHIKAHALVTLDFVLFLRRLAREASVQAELRNDARLEARHVEAVADRVLRRMRA